ncbi:MAG: SCO family protein [Paracraurococcus sp.]|jgi:protein SCO1
MNRRGFAAAGLAAALAPLVPSRPAVAATPSSRGAGYFTDAVVTTHRNEKVRFYTDLIQGKRVLINFVFVGCTDVCDSVTQNLVLIQDLLGERLGRDVFMYSITLQPDFDTPEVLDAYAERFGIRPGWSFLTGNPPEIDILRRRLGFADIDPKLDLDIFQHAAMLRIGDEGLDRWTMAAALMRPEALIKAINRTILREEK